MEPDTTGAERVADSAREINDELFTKHKGGWADDIGLALVDAVYSIGARYSGVELHLKDLAQQLREQGGGTDSLAVIADLPEEVIIGAMGRSRVAPGKARSTSKAAAVKEAAARLGELGVDNAAQLRGYLDDPAHSPADIYAAYTSVYGLGKVTAEYFLMLLGVPGIKADRMVTRFVARAVGRSVSPVEARRLVEQAHELLKGEKKFKRVTLTQFDHGIWLHEREVGH